MRSVNIVLLLGHLTRDPELRQTASGHPVATFSIATNRYWTTSGGDKQEATEYHDLVAWGKLAEIVHEQLTKGCAVWVAGRLHTRSWEAPDGNKRHKTEVVIHDLNIITRKTRTVSESSENSTAGAVLTDREAAEEEHIVQEIDSLDLESGGLPGEKSEE